MAGILPAKRYIPTCRSNNQIHATEGESGSTTMVMVFVMLFVLFVQFLTLEVSQSEPPRLAPYQRAVASTGYLRPWRILLSWKCRFFRCCPQLVLTTWCRVFLTRRPNTADVSATSCDVGFFISVSYVVSLPNCRHVVVGTTTTYPFLSCSGFLIKRRSPLDALSSSTLSPLLASSNAPAESF